jgi:hypothetical protein
MEEGTGAFNILADKPAKRPLGKSRCRWKHNIRIDLKEICIYTRD